MKGDSPRSLKPEDLPVNGKFAFEPQTSFTDGFPFLLASMESLENLNSKLEKPAEMKNFRPNIIVRGCRAFEEDDWRTIRIAGKTFYIISMCTRCTVSSHTPYPYPYYPASFIQCVGRVF